MQLLTDAVCLQVLNGSSDDVGVYTCAGEREKDRTYISSWVIPAHSSQYPIMFFLPCEDSVTAHRQSFNSLRDTLTYEVSNKDLIPFCYFCDYRTPVDVKSIDFVQSVDLCSDVRDSQPSALSVIAKLHYTNKLSSKFMSGAPDTNLLYNLVADKLH
jgi:hypothetical protein